MDNRKTRVLLIEDNPGDARLIQELLVEARESPFDIDHAERLSTGLDRLTRGGIDVILLDLSLPDSQGLDSLGKLYAQAPKVPVVVLSSIDDETLAVEAVHRGAQDYLVKGSVDRNLLVRSMRYAIERHRLRHALRDSEARYRLLADNAADIIWTRDINLHTTYVSPSVTQMSGYSVEEVMSLSLEESMAPASLEVVRTALSKVLAPERKGQSDLSEAVVLELELIRKDGSIVPVEMKVNLLRDSNGRPNGFLGVTRDITERKKAEEALRESEERLRRLVNNAPDIIFRWSVEKGLEYVSPVVSAITGYSPEELMASPRVGLELAMAKDPQLPADYEKATSEGIYTRVRELPFVRKDGRQAYLDIRTQEVTDNEGKVVAFEGILRDITERKKAEEALRESEEHYSALVSSLTDAVFKIKGGVIAWCNDKVEAIYGYTKEELVGKKVSYLFPEGVDYREFVGAVSSAIKEYRFSHDMGRVKRKDGSLVDVEYTLSQIPGRDPIELVTVARDITERKLFDERLRLAGRLAAVGELAAGVAHELNNPLTAIQGFAQFLTLRDNLDEPVKKDLETIYREAQRATKITKNLLSFARQHEPEKRLISINEALAKTLDLYTHQMKVNNIELSVEFAPDLPMTMADFYQMQQVFVNIVNNAEQAMVEAHGRGKFFVKSKRTEEMIRITFADDGPGISEENLKRIFDPFFTTKEVGKGTGLGLSICYGLVEAHGGHIYARSKPGQGATFVVEIPIVCNGK